MNLQTLTRKDYIFIAEGLSKKPDTVEKIVVVMKLINLLRKDRDEFNSDIFLKASLNKYEN